MSHHGIPSLPVVPVRGSSNVKGIGYDPATYTMDVQFHEGGTYRYHGVPQTVHDSFTGAQSKGSFLRANISGRFRHTKV